MASWPTSFVSSVGTEWESLESDCAGELELIRYTVCTLALAFEDSAAAAISWERSLSLGSRLDRAHSQAAFQLASVKDHWPGENRQGYLRRRHQCGDQKFQANCAISRPVPLAGGLPGPACSESALGKVLDQARSQLETTPKQELRRARLEGLTANPIGIPHPDSLSRWYSYAHRFLSRHPLFRQSH
jgi:hypothetical protein